MLNGSIFNKTDFYIQKSQEEPKIVEKKQFFSTFLLNFCTLMENDNVLNVADADFRKKFYWPINSGNMLEKLDFTILQIFFFRFFQFFCRHMHISNVFGVRFLEFFFRLKMSEIAIFWIFLRFFHYTFCSRYALLYAKRPLFEKRVFADFWARNVLKTTSFQFFSSNFLLPFVLFVYLTFFIILLVKSR